jgi:hypothetical protein
METGRVIAGASKNKGLDVYESIMFGESLSGFRVRVFNATFNNISVISWWSVF